MGKKKRKARKAKRVVRAKGLLRRLLDKVLK